ncbi:UNVERIFIED_CONTAM: hypothetical protein GTU68_033064 [Idotea baltica]|nr:hypothetical protein [Idotea baltica]
MVDTNDEWIKSRTGIEERRILKDKDKATVYMGHQAVQGLLEKTGTDPKEIDLLICATVTADMAFPDNATQINHKIGATNAFGYDLSAACSGFLYAFTSACHLIESGRYKKIIVLGTDKMSSILDYTDRSSCIIFGDAASAVMLEPNSEFGFEDSILRGDGSGAELLFQKGGGSLNPASEETDGRTVFKSAVLNMGQVVKKVMDKNHMDINDLDWLVPHQANLRIITAVANQVDLPIEKVMINIQKYGNTTAATIPLCLWEWENKLKKGDRVILTAFGGGFTWGATYLTWAYDQA